VTCADWDINKQPPGSPQLIKGAGGWLALGQPNPLRGVEPDPCRDVEPDPWHGWRKSGIGRRSPAPPREDSRARLTQIKKIPELAFPALTVRAVK
jgi:hypothetical protein